MDFSWAINALKEGKKVTRRSLAGDPPIYLYWNKTDDTIMRDYGARTDSKWHPSLDNLFAEDWEEYVEPKKAAQDKIPKAGSMENCQILSNAINQLLESIGVMPHLTVTLVPGPEDKELTIAIRTDSENGAANYPIHVDSNMQISSQDSIDCHVVNPDGIIKSSIGSPVKSTKPVAGGYEVEDMQSNLGKED